MFNFVRRSRAASQSLQRRRLFPSVSTCEDEHPATTLVARSSVCTSVDHLPPGEGAAVHSKLYNVFLARVLILKGQYCLTVDLNTRPFEISLLLLSLLSILLLLFYLVSILVLLYGKCIQNVF